MTVLVLNPPADNGIQYLKEGRCESRAGAQLTVPITLAVVAAVVRRAGLRVLLRDHAVSPWDRDAPGHTPEGRALGEARLALLVTTTPTFPSDARFAAWLRARRPDLPIVAWGTLPTALPERALAEAPALDAVILGEPEGAVADLCAPRAGHLRDALGGVAGLAVRVAGGVVRTPPRARAPALDDLPWAARDLLENHRYTEPSHGEPFTVIQVSRGCPYPCTYCTVADYHGKAQRWRSPGSVVAEVRHCVAHHGIRAFLFLADLFTADRAWVLALCEALCAARLDVRWFCNSRADTLDEPMARAMRAAGCYLVSFGVESAVPTIQRTIRKPVRPERFVAAADVCRRAGLRSYFYWVFGFPGETRETIRETYALACRADSDFAAFYHAVPYPGTALHAWARREGRLRHEDWSRYDMSGCDALVLDALTPEELSHEIRRAGLGYYLRPSYLRSVPTRFTPRELVSLSRRAVSYLPSLARAQA